MNLTYKYLPQIEREEKILIKQREIYLSLAASSKVEERAEYLFNVAGQLELRLLVVRSYLAKHRGDY